MEFPPNLDDGEHYYWLPSDIFPDDEYQYEYEVSLPPKKNYSSTCMPPKFPPSSSAFDFTCMAMDQPLICQHFSSYPPSSPRLERLIPPSSTFGSLAQPEKVVGSGSSTSHAHCYQSGPLHVCNVRQSPYSQAQRVIEIRTRQLQLQQYHHQFLPIPRTGFGRDHHGGLVRTPLGLGTGTGVFLPRIAASSTTPLNQATTRVNSKPLKKQAAGGKNMNRQERVQSQASPISERKSMSSFGLGQSADFHYQLSPPDMGLPPEWTY